VTPSRLTELAQLEYSLYHHKQSYPGKFVVIEGADGVGKSTVARLFPLTVSQPSIGPIGAGIRQMLNSRVIPPVNLPLLFAGDRSWHLRSVILPALDKEETVVCDRYTLSSIVYQSFNPDGSFNEERALETRRLNEIFYQPDLTVILTCDIEVCMKRIAERSTERQAMENEPFQRSVHAAYLSHKQTDKTIVFDTHNHTPEQIVRGVMDRIQ